MGLSPAYTKATVQETPPQYLNEYPAFLSMTPRSMSIFQAFPCWRCLSSCLLPGHAAAVPRGACPARPDAAVRCARLLDDERENPDRDEGGDAHDEAGGGDCRSPCGCLAGRCDAPEVEPWGTRCRRNTRNGDDGHLRESQAPGGGSTIAEVVVSATIAEPCAISTIAEMMKGRNTLGRPSQLWRRQGYCNPGRLAPCRSCRQCR